MWVPGLDDKHPYCWPSSPALKEWLTFPTQFPHSSRGSTVVWISQNKFFLGNSFVFAVGKGEGIPSRSTGKLTWASSTVLSGWIKLFKVVFMSSKLIGQEWGSHFLVWRASVCVCMGIYMIHTLIFVKTLWVDLFSESWCISLIPAHRKWKQGELCEFKASLDYIKCLFHVI